MSILKSVAISGTVGKQVFSSAQPTILKGVILDAGATSAGSFTLRDGYASGDIILTGRKPANDSGPFSLAGKVKLDKGLHVKVL